MKDCWKIGFVPLKQKFYFGLISGLLFLCCITPVIAGNRVFAWGDNTYGQTNVPASATNVMAIAAGATYSLALKSDGTVIAWGQSGRTNIPNGLSNVVAIAAGKGQSLALKNDGTLVAWGAPSTLATTNIPSGLSNILAIACGDSHNLVLKVDGTIYAWGANFSGQTNIPSNATNIVAIVAGNSSNLAIKRGGLAWGSNNAITNQTTSFSNIVAGALVANGSQGGIVLGTGVARVWGYPQFASMTIISNVITAVGYSPFNQAGPVLVLRRNGTLTYLNGSLLTNNFMGLSNVLAIAMTSHFMAVVGDNLSSPVEPMTNAVFNAGQLSVSQPTSLGRSYRLEYKDFLDGDWQMFPPVPGNGTTQTLSDPNPPSAQRFYRVNTTP